MIIWSSSFILTQIGLESFAPVTLVTIRMSLATVLLFLLGKLTGKLQRLKKQDLLLFVVGGFFQPFCYFICEAYGLQLVSPTIASVILSTIPLFSPLFAFLFIRERVTWTTLLGILISFLGVLLLVTEKEHISVHPMGLVLLLLAVFSAVMYTIILRKIPPTYSNVSIVFYMEAFSVLFFIPTFFVVDVQTIGALTIKWESVLSIVLLAVFASVAAYLLFAEAVRHIGVTRANAFCNIQPGSTALLMWIFFKEALPWVKIGAIAIVILGLFLSQMPLHRTKKIKQRL